MKMKQVAEENLGEAAHDAVLTVPACFTEKQRRATQEAARLAGWNPRRLLPESIAAALGHGLGSFRPGGTYLIYDLGGGKFDASLIRVQEGEFTVLASAGDSRLGGCDFDGLISDWAVERLKPKSGLDIPSSTREKIKYLAEQMKQTLSTVANARMIVPDLEGGKGLDRLTMTRHEFEEIIDPLLHKTLQHAEEALEQAKLRRDELDGILLVGGSTRIPRVRAMLLDYFQKGEEFLCGRGDPELVVAQGAAIHAAQVAERPQQDEDVCFNMIAEKSIGFATSDGQIVKVIPQGCQLPAQEKRRFEINNPGGQVEIPIYQGEGQTAAENDLLGIYQLDPMQPVPAGGAFEISFMVDESGLLNLTVDFQGPGEHFQGKLVPKGGGDFISKRDRLEKLFQGREPKPSPDEKQRTINREFEDEENDDGEKHLAILESFVQWATGFLERYENLLNESQKDRLQQGIGEGKIILTEENRDAALDAILFLDKVMARCGTPSLIDQAHLAASAADEETARDLLKAADELQTFALQGNEEKVNQLKDPLASLIRLVHQKLQDIEKISAVRDFGLLPEPSQRKMQPDVLPAPSQRKKQPDLREAQFTIYRPKTIRPEEWYPMLAFTHLAERPPEAPQSKPDPIEQVRMQARQVLGIQVKDYRDTSVDARQAVPEEAEITLLPEIPGIQFNPERRVFRWIEDIHREEFRLRASAELDGQVARGRLIVLLGVIILAEVDLAIKVDSTCQVPVDDPPAEGETARPYRKIFASYSHKDAEIVQQYEAFGKTLGDQYLRDVHDLKAGENWDEALLQLINQADIFQLFWSTNSMRSPYVRREWEHALSLSRQAFIRPTYWEVPLPEAPDLDLPPEILRRLHFQRISLKPPGPVKKMEDPNADQKFLEKVADLLSEQLNYNRNLIFRKEEEPGNKEKTLIEPLLAERAAIVEMINAKTAGREILPDDNLFTSACDRIHALRQHISSLRKRLGFPEAIETLNQLSQRVEKDWGQLEQLSIKHHFRTFNDHMEALNRRGGFTDKNQLIQERVFWHTLRTGIEADCRRLSNPEVHRELEKLLSAVKNALLQLEPSSIPACAEPIPACAESPGGPSRRGVLYSSRGPGPKRWRAPKKRTMSIIGLILLLILGLVLLFSFFMNQ